MSEQAREDVLASVEEQVIALDALLPEDAKIHGERERRLRGWDAYTVYTAAGGFQVSVNDETIVVNEVADDGRSLAKNTSPLVSVGTADAPRYQIVDEAVKRLHDRLYRAGYF